MSGGDNNVKRNALHYKKDKKKCEKICENRDPVDKQEM